MALVPLILLTPVLIAVAYSDLRYLRIPNLLVGIALFLFLVTTPLIGIPEAAIRLLAGVIVFSVGAVTFALRWFGGGDVKMLAALVLFVPSQTYSLFALNFSVAMLVGISFLLMLRRAPGVQNLGFEGIAAQGKFPMGISIAGAGILHLFVVNLLA